jgi:molybdenum cofactor synthesis domain-containing protein
LKAFYAAGRFGYTKSLLHLNALNTGINMTEAPKSVTAAMLAIGDELLSGRTKDRNIAYLADFLTLSGIDLREVRIVPDSHDEIVAAVNALRTRYYYLFTSGGIGPTHDDITADAIADAFNVPIYYDPRAISVLEKHYKAREIAFTPARKRMARIPQGAELVDNRVSAAPGFRIGNVFVLAGVPSIFQAMLESLAPYLETGQKMHSVTIDCDLPEGAIGTQLAAIQQQYPDTVIGSYPRFDGERFSVQIVIRGHDQAAIANTREFIEAMLDTLINQERHAGNNTNDL